MLVVFARAEKLVFEVVQHASCKCSRPCLQHLCDFSVVGRADRYLAEGLSLVETELDACPSRSLVVLCR